MRRMSSRHAKKTYKPYLKIEKFLVIGLLSGVILAQSAANRIGTGRLPVRNLAWLPVVRTLRGLLRCPRKRLLLFAELGATVTDE